MSITATSPSRPSGNTARQSPRRICARDRSTETSISGPYGSQADQLAIRHNILRDALVAAYGTPVEGTEAMGARIKTLLGLGLRRDAGPAPGRGRGHRNRLQDALEVALALMLQRAFVPPAAAVALITGNRPTLDPLWASAARGGQATATVAIDALSHTGRDGMRSGRFSEDPVGTLTLVGPGREQTDRSPLGPPLISVDMRALYDITTDNLRRAGVPLVDLRRAGGGLAGTD